MTRTATQKGRAIVVACSVLAAAAGALALQADLMVSYGFGRASVPQEAVLPFEAASSIGWVEAQPGDDGYSPAAFEHQGPFDRRLAVGDRITIAGSDGRVRLLEVVDLRAVAAPLLKVAADAPSVRLLRVTCRVVGPAEGSKPEYVRFFVEVEDPKPLQQPQGPLGPT